MKKYFFWITIIPFFFNSCIVLPIYERIENSSMKKIPIIQKTKITNFKTTGLYYFHTYLNNIDSFNIEIENKNEALPYKILQFDTINNLSFGVSLHPNIKNENRLKIKPNKEYLTYGYFNSFLFPNTYIQTKSNTIEEKIKIYNLEIEKYYKNLETFWYLYNCNNDTITLFTYDTRLYFSPTPIITVTHKTIYHIKLKIINDTTLKLLKLQNQNENYNYSDSNYYFKFYKTDARIDFSKSFFNTNKSYLRYCERMHRKEEKRKKKLTTALH